MNNLIMHKDKLLEKMQTFIGKYVLIRTYSEGLNCGYLEIADKDGCYLREARRIHTPVSKNRNMSWYEGISVSGLCKDNGRITNKVDKIILEDYSITECNKIAQESLENFKTNKTTC